MLWYSGCQPSCLVTELKKLLPAEQPAQFFTVQAVPEQEEDVSDTIYQALRISVGTKIIDCLTEGCHGHVMHHNPRQQTRMLRLAGQLRHCAASCHNIPAGLLWLGDWYIGRGQFKRFTL